MDMKQSNETKAKNERVGVEIIHKNGINKLKCIAYRKTSSIDIMWDNNPNIISENKTWTSFMSKNLTHPHKIEEKKPENLLNKTFTHKNGVDTMTITAVRSLMDLDFCWNNNPQILTKNSYYSVIKFSQLKNPSNNLAENINKTITKKDGDVITIIDINSYDDVTVMFNNDIDLITKTNLQAFNKGQVTNPKTKTNRLRENRIGKSFKHKNDIDVMTIYEYIDSQNCSVFWNGDKNIITEKISYSMVVNSLIGNPLIAFVYSGSNRIGAETYHKKYGFKIIVISYNKYNEIYCMLDENYDYVVKTNWDSFEKGNIINTELTCYNYGLIFKKTSALYHENKYNYDFFDYIDSKTKGKIICPEHGEFWQTPNSHMTRVNGCPKCPHSASEGETEMLEFIKQNTHFFVKDNCRETIINPVSGKNFELDIYIPELKLAFEYDGLFTHCDVRKPKEYHASKTKLCEELGIQLIHVYEDEWIKFKDIVKSRILNLLNKTPHKIFARKCEVDIVDNNKAKVFLEENHIQGFVGGTLKLGLYYEDELVSLMTFGDYRKIMGLTKVEDCYELLRFCNKINTNVVGGASKLLKYFIKTHKPKEILTYADKRWSNGKLYHLLGFEYVHTSAPNYDYVKNIKRYNRFVYRKDVLIKEGYDPNKTEKEIMKERGFNRIYNCGNMKFLMKF